MRDNLIGSNGDEVIGFGRATGAFVVRGRVQLDSRAVCSICSAGSPTNLGRAPTATCRIDTVTVARADVSCASTGFVALQAQSDQMAQQQARLLRELAQVDETLTELRQHEALRPKALSAGISWLLMGSGSS